jgi:hypothetical protein
MLNQAYRFAEELLRRAAAVHMADRPNMRDEALGVVTKGKKKTLEKLTFGETVNFIASLDRKRRLVPGQKVVSKTDKALLKRLSSSRNSFAHGQAATRLHEEEIRSFLNDVARVCTLAVVEAAVRSEADESRAS